MRWSKNFVLYMASPVMNAALDEAELDHVSTKTTIIRMTDCAEEEPRVIAPETIGIDLIDQGDGVIGGLVLHDHVDHPEGVEQRIGHVDDQQKEGRGRKERQDDREETAWTRAAIENAASRTEAGMLCKPDRKKMKL